MDERQGRFDPNREEIASKVIDGELIIIRLSDGTYYSMDDVGTCMWQLIVAGHAVADVARTIADWYALPIERSTSDVSALVHELVGERLIVAAPHATAEASVVDPPAAPRNYEAPKLQIYRDMGNLLALDPPTPGIDDLLFKNPKAD